MYMYANFSICMVGIVMFSVILKFKDLALFNVIIFLTTELFLQNSELNVEKKWMEIELTLIVIGKNAYS